MAESWQTLSTTSFSVGRMVLLTDGSVLACTYGDLFRTRNWHKLVPGGRGDNYAEGTWRPVRSMSHSRHAVWLSAVVLKNGKVLVWGGSGWSGEADYTPEIYDPFTDSWTDAANDINSGAVSAFGATCVLADGKVLLGSDDYWNSGGRGWTILFDPESARWAEMPNGDDTVPGRGFTLLPDGSILKNPRRTQRYLPGEGRWRFTAESPLPTEGMAGLALLLPDGRVWVVAPPPPFGDGRTRSYFYHPPSDSHPDHWEEAAEFPVELSLSAPAITNDACLLPSGRVLSSVAVFQHPPLPRQIYEFDPTPREESPVGRLRLVPNPSARPFDYGCLLLLPTGQVLVDGQTGIHIYTPDPDDPANNPRDEWRPRIESINRSSTFPVHLGSTTHSLEGYQLNGLSQAHSAAECGLATNYPLISLTYTSGRVVYLPTLNHSSMGVATGMSTRQSTSFKVSARTPRGRAKLCVIANGIRSLECVDVIIEGGRAPKPEMAVGNILIGNFADGEYIIVGPQGIRPGPKPWESLIDPSLLKAVEETTKALFHQFQALKRESQASSSKTEVQISRSGVLKMLIRFIGVFFRR